MNLTTHPNNLSGLRILLLIISFGIVAFGQPAWLWWVGLISSACGYAIFFRAIIDLPQKKKFWIATAWYACVQAVQISWMLTHPYSYIYFVYVGFVFLLGLQCGLFSLLLTYENVLKLPRMLALAATWTLLEWSRLYFLSGYSWNPAGIALSGSIYSLQAASIFGVFGLSFWVILVNLYLLRAALSQKSTSWITWATLAALPYLFGSLHVYVHQKQMLGRNDSPINTLLVQTAFPAEEALPFDSKASYIAFVLEEWRQILSLVKNHKDKPIDLIAMPEYVVPFGTYTYLYPQEYVETAFIDAFGPDSINKLPALEEPHAKSYATAKGPVYFVNNAYWAQGIANVMNTELIVGLEDAEELSEGNIEYYSAAIYFKPSKEAESFDAERYSKRVLLPMAEYIPFSFCQELAASYGIQGSFTPGKEARVLQGSACPFSVSICYEETFGNLMCEGRRAGSEMLVNLTSDVWYPNSLLPQQHFDHARLRTVESGIPLVRACNTGITSAFDSLGRTVAMLGDGSVESQWLADSLYVEVPRYHYSTFYSQVGNYLIIGFCFLCLPFYIRRKS